MRRGHKIIILTVISILFLFGVCLSQNIFSPQEVRINVSVAGEAVSLDVLKITMEDEIFISPYDPQILRLALRLGSNYKIDEKKNLIIITRDSEEYKIHLEGMELEINKELSNVAVKSLTHKDKLYVSFKVLFKLLGGQLVCDEKNDKYYCDPMITSVDLIKEGSRYILKVTASGPVNYNYFYLRDPQRYVLDVQNAILVADKKEIGNDDVGIIKYSQFNSKPNIVRFVIPLDKDIEVESQPRMFLNQIIFALSLPKVSTTIGNFTQAKIKEVSVKDEADGFTVKVETDVPVQYQWRRLKPPDNRMFLDIPDSVFPGVVKEFKIKGSYFIESVKTAQFQKDPKPITRVVLNFKKPAAVNVRAEGASQVLIEVKNIELKEEEISYSGAGVTAFPAKGKIICIDPGHGGSDTGAINRGLDIYEKNLNLDLARRLSGVLIRDGWNVVMTRDEDEDVSSPRASAVDELSARASVANDMKADIFVSIHCNSMYQAHWNGTSTHWYKKIDFDLAKAIQESLVAKIALKDKGVIRSRFYVLRVTKMPSALVECAFMSNPKEITLLATDDFRQKIAEGIADGLRVYIAGQ